MKAWFEKKSVKEDTWTLKVTGIEEEEATKVQQQILRHFGITKSSSWTSLVRSASARPSMSKSDIIDIRLPIPLEAFVSSR